MRVARRKMNGSKAAAAVATAAATAAAVLFAMETKMRLIDGLRKCGEEEGCGWRVGRLERRISGKQPPIGGKVRSKNY